MGPRSEERGNHRDCHRADGRRGRFNGAALRGARKRANGGSGLLKAALLLQWGRAPRSAETAVDWVAVWALPEASMGPRSEERGNGHFVVVRGSAGCGFNGAALRGARKRLADPASFTSYTGLQWGRAPRSAETTTRRTLPRTVGSFNGAALRGARKPPPRLATWLPWRCFNGAALRGARKQHDLGRRVLRYADASMGPRSEERGNVDYYAHQ